MVHEEDKYWGNTLKVGLNSLVGNPHATEEEVAKQGWGDIITPDAPDYSAESFQQAGQEMGQTWKDTGRSLTEDGYGGLQNDLAADAAGHLRGAAGAGPRRPLRPVPRGTRPAAAADRAVRADGVGGF